MAPGLSRLAPSWAWRVCRPRLALPDRAARRCARAWVCQQGLATAHRSNASGEWYVPDVSLVEPSAKHVAIGMQLHADMAVRVAKLLPTGSGADSAQTTPSF